MIFSKFYTGTYPVRVRTFAESHFKTSVDFTMLLKGFPSSQTCGFDDFGWHLRNSRKWDTLEAYSCKIMNFIGQPLASLPIVCFQNRYLFLKKMVSMKNSDSSSMNIYYLNFLWKCKSRLLEGFYKRYQKDGMQYCSSSSFQNWTRISFSIAIFCLKDGQKRIPIYQKTVPKCEITYRIYCKKMALLLNTTGFW